MPFVLDASIAACWAFEDEDHPRATLALERIRTDVARVPSLWWFELRNVLLVNQRRGRISELDTARFLRDLSHLGVTLDWSPDETALLNLARQYRLTVYDASYLELARRADYRSPRLIPTWRARRGPKIWRLSTRRPADGRACLRLPFRLEHTMNDKPIDLRSRAMTMTPCAWGEDPMNSETT
jgi:predicted nucleic acid-binding protein